MTHIIVPTELPTPEERESFYANHVEFVRSLFKPLDKLATIDQPRFEVTQVVVDLSSSIVNLASLMDAMFNFFVSPTDMDLRFSPAERWDRLGRMRNYGHYLNHSVFGNLGETGELNDCVKRYTIYCGDKLNKDNFEEEMGDILFFVTTCHLFFELENLKSDLIAHLNDMGVSDYENAATNVLEASEKDVAALCVEIKTDIMRAIRVVYQPESEEEVTSIYDGFLLNNFIKLRARYEKGYSDEAAHARADKA